MRDKARMLREMVKRRGGANERKRERQEGDRGKDI